jgi:hypothetical protein
VRTDTYDASKEHLAEMVAMARKRQLEDPET